MNFQLATGKFYYRDESVLRSIAIPISRQRNSSFSHEILLWGSMVNHMTTPCSSVTFNQRVL